MGSDNRRVAYGTNRAQMMWLDATHPRSWAESHLIAAAPEMLEALKTARACVNDPKIAVKIDRVIAKAEGSVR